MPLTFQNASPWNPSWLSDAHATSKDPKSETTQKRTPSPSKPRLVMPKSRNLPMTTRGPISDAKAREFLLPSSSWGSHCYRRSGYREEPWVLGYVAYIGSVHEKKKEFLDRGPSDWSLSFEGLCIGF